MAVSPEPWFAGQYATARRRRAMAQAIPDILAYPQRFRCGAGGAAGYKGRHQGETHGRRDDRGAGQPDPRAAAQHRGGAGAARGAPRQQRRLRPGRLDRAGDALLRSGARADLRGRGRTDPQERARHAGHHQGLLRGGRRPRRARRPGLSRAARGRGDLALRGAGLCAADLRPRDPPGADRSRPVDLRAGGADGGRQRGEGPDRRGGAGALPARRAGQGRPRLPDLPPGGDRRGQGGERRLRARRRAGRDSRRGSSTSTSGSGGCIRRTF